MRLQFFSHIASPKRHWVSRFLLVSCCLLWLPLSLTPIGTPATLHEHDGHSHHHAAGGAHHEHRAIDRAPDAPRRRLYDIALDAQQREEERGNSSGEEDSSEESLLLSLVLTGGAALHAVPATLALATPLLGTSCTPVLLLPSRHFLRDTDIRGPPGDDVNETA